MVFCTPIKAAQYVGSYSPLLSPYQGRELRRAGQFLCELIGKVIANTEGVRESYNKIFPNLLSVPPLPPGPPPSLAAEYIYGSFLLSLTGTEQETKEKYRAVCMQMEQQLIQEIKEKPSLDDICTYTLKAASLYYLNAAGIFLYSPKSELPAKSIKFNLRQAILKYRRLDTLFDKLDAVPEMTPARCEVLEELGFLSDIGYHTEHYRKLKEVKRGDPALMSVRNLNRVSSDITYGLFKYIPLHRRFFQELWGDLKKKGAKFKEIKKGVVDFFYEDKHKILRQDVLLGLMRCYALRGDYQKIRETADRLEKIMQKPEHFPLEEIATYAQRLELGAQENKISSRKCRPFVPQAPEAVPQQIERFISAYEGSSKRLVMRSPFLGEQEVGRQVRLAA